jgi:hypothetical protein
METNDKDQHLWHMARKRVKFKRHLATYLIINTMLWLLWLYTDNEKNNDFPWPAFSSIGWGIGLAFDYMSSYGITRDNAVEKEYEKLKGRDRQ